MATLTNVKITNIKGTSSAASSTGTITSATGDEEYISRWMPGDAAPAITGSFTIASGDITGGDWKHRPMFEIAVWDNRSGGWGYGNRYWASAYRTTAGTSNFSWGIPTSELSPGTKYRVTVYITKALPSVTSPYQPFTAYGPRLRTSFWTNRTPGIPNIVDPPTGVSYPYGDGANSQFEINWTATDPDAVPGDGDYYGYELQYRTTPSPANPNPAWQYATLDAFYSTFPNPKISHSSWALDDGTSWSDFFGFPSIGVGGATGGNTDTILVSAAGGYAAGTPTNRILMLLGPGTWQIRVRSFDYSGSGQTAPSGIPAYGTSEWSNTVTINITAPFLPPLPLAPGNDEAAVAAVPETLTFEWLFRDPRASGGTQQSARLRIRKVGDEAWEEIIPNIAPLTAFATGGQTSGVSVNDAGTIVHVADSTNNRIRKFDVASGSELLSWACASPADLTLDSTGNVYAVDYTNNLVRKYSPTGAVLASWSTTGTPNSITIVGSTVFVTDDTNKVLRRFSLTGTVGTTLGTTGAPVDMDMDTAGNIYVLDKTNALVRKYTNTGTPITTWPTAGNPTTLAVSPTGYVVVGQVLSTTVGLYSLTGTLLRTYTVPAGCASLDVDDSGKFYVGFLGQAVYVYDGTIPQAVPLVITEGKYVWTNGTEGFTVEPGFQYEWQPRTVATPGNFDSGWSGPTATFWAIPAPGSGGEIPVPDITVPDPGLGCGNNRPFLFRRGGAIRLGEITDTELVRWGRTRDGISTATVRVRGWGDDCGKLLEIMRSWMHEIVIYRDNGSGPKRVWEGPITRITYGVDYVDIEAQDVWVYVYRRILRQGFNDAYRRVGWKYGPGGTVLVRGKEYGLTRVTRRAAMIVNNALAYDDPNLLAYLSVIEKPDDARQSRVVPDYSTTAWQQIDDFAAKSGLDYTAAGRRMILWDTHNALGTLPEMRDNDFGEPPIVTEYGMQLANFYGVTNNAGVYGTASRLTDGQPKFYGWIEMLASAYGESDEGGGAIETLTAAQQAALEEALTEQAERNISSRWPTPLVVRVPDNTTLSPEVNIGINHLIPGVFIPVRATGTLRQVMQMQKLDSMQVTQTKDGEVITVTLSPAPRSRNEDPDEGGVEA